MTCAAWCTARIVAFNASASDDLKDAWGLLVVPIQRARSLSVGAVSGGSYRLDLRG